MYISLINIIILLIVTACAITPKEQEEILVHMSQPIRIMGKSFSNKFERDGLIGNEFVAIGSTNNYGHLQFAKNEAISRLINNAPTEFERIVKRSVSRRSGRVVRIEDFSATTSKVQNLIGIKSANEDIECVKYIVPVLNYDFEEKIECRVLVRVPVANLIEAYASRLDKEYGIKEKDILQEIVIERSSAQTETNSKIHEFNP